MKKEPTGSYIWGFHERTPSEARFRESLRKAGIRFEEEVPVKEFTVDFLIDGWLIVEIDGESHLTSSRAEKDRRKQQALEDAGFTLVRVPAMDTGSPGGLKRWVRRIRGILDAGPPGLRDAKFDNRDLKRQVEEARKRLMEKALKDGEAIRMTREKMAHGEKSPGPKSACGAGEEETMEDYFGRPGEDFRALLEKYDFGKMPSKDEEDEDARDKNKRVSRRQ